MVQKVLERATLTFFLQKQSNTFCTAINQAVVDICGRDRKERQFFLGEIGVRPRFSFFRVQQSCSLKT